MFNDNFAYKLKSTHTNGIDEYYVGFYDGQGVYTETKVDYEIYLEIVQFRKNEERVRRHDKRYIENASLTDEEMHMRAVHKAQTINEYLSAEMLSKDIDTALDSLTDTQKNRFILHCLFGMTFQQISEMDKCSRKAVFDSVKLAINKLKATLSCYD